MPAQVPQRRGLDAGWGPPIGIAVGAAIGLIVGQVLGQLALGVALGAAFGLLAGAIATTSKDSLAGRRRGVLFSATAILVVGVVAAVIVLVS